MTHSTSAAKTFAEVDVVIVLFQFYIFKQYCSRWLGYDDDTFMVLLGYFLFLCSHRRGVALNKNN